MYRIAGLVAKVKVDFSFFENLVLGRRPKASCTLATMFRYSLGILICFKHTFVNDQFHWGWGETLYLRTAIMSSTIVHFDRNGVDTKESNLVHGFKCCKMKNAGIYTRQLVKLTDKLTKSSSVGRFSIKKPVEWSLWFYPWILILYR